MAKSLVWCDLSEKQISIILEECDSSASIEEKLQCFMKLNDKADARSGILLDMYLHAFLFTQDNRFTTEKTSAFISIIKDIHTKSVGEFLTLDRSWQRTKDLLLMHSVQRPPFSIQIFSWADLKAITSFILNTHYKLYQYSFCPNYILNLDTYKEEIEIAPSIPSLSEAIGQEQWDAEQEALRKQQEREMLKKLAEEAEAEEAARQASIEAAYRNAVPEELAHKTKALIDFYLDNMKAQLVSMLQEQEKRMEEKFLSLHIQAKGK
ncbi:hypothetical protein KP509_17G025000 [Ceratopteris richardii]|uniref:Uncharacterized protein n=1 Tax=Ceratopteris richardii TaxID=49495 RepID=A0A8T2SUF5_CERRI|nr:hypothetical protein KP509_17G025000 [Ceratopteris richardii]